MKQKRLILMILLASVIFGVFLWFSTDPPPCSQAVSELSDFYWGFLVDVTAKWRTGNFTFWDRGVGAGTSFFQSGSYPILSPLNVLAWFLNDDQVFIFSMVIPYVVGFFFCLLIFLTIFNLGWPYALFGALYYLGMGLAKYGGLARLPFDFWGPMLLPAMFYAFLKLNKKDIFFASWIVGCLIALQFAIGGLMEFLQIILWWLIFLPVVTIQNMKKEFWARKIGNWIFSSFWLLVATVGLFAIQLFPIYYFVKYDSARLPGYYSLNNFPLFAGWDYLEGTLSALIHRYFILGSGISSRGIMALWLVSAALFIVRRGSLSKDQKEFLRNIWITTVIYFLLPTFVDLLSQTLPFLTPLLSNFSRFTIKYGIYTLDFCLAITLAVLLSFEGLSFQTIKSLSLRLKLVICFLVFSGFVFVSFPIFMALPSMQEFFLKISPFFQNFIPGNIVNVLLLWGCTMMIVVQMGFRFKKYGWPFLSGMALVFIGFMCFIYGYNWNDKAKRIDVWKEAYGIGYPEVEYYSKARGKFYLPFEEPVMMSHNYNLLHGVYGTGGFVQIPTFRFSKFCTSYHNSRFDTVPYWPITKYSIVNPSEALANYFRVDFTTTQKNKTLPWKGFRREVEGKEYDVWVRQEPPQKISFGSSLQCVDYKKILEALDRPFEGKILVENEDCQNFEITPQELSPPVRSEARYSDYQQIRQDRIRFKVRAPRDVFVLVPDIFQSGWEVYDNGVKVKIFPAQYLFIGFALTAGEHIIEMKYVPPGLRWGVEVSFITFFLFFVGIVRYNIKNKTVR